MKEVLANVESVVQLVKLAWENEQWEWLIAWIAITLASVKILISITRFVAPKIKTTFLAIKRFVIIPPTPLPTPSELCEHITHMLQNEQSDWAESEKYLVCGPLEVKWVNAVNGSEGTLRVCLEGFNPFDFLSELDARRVRETINATVEYHRKKTRSSNINKMVDAILIRNKGGEVLHLTKDEAKRVRG